MNWNDLKYWSSGEWQVVQERLDDMKAAKTLVNPAREHLFRALNETPYGKVKVVFVGQDPYPGIGMATGLAFESPENKPIPPSLSTILKEYSADLHLPMPGTGVLGSWALEGVLLWNVYPSCTVGLSMSHAWPEWELLTKEILQVLSVDTTAIFVAFGSVAQSMCRKYIDDGDSEVLNLSHPAPRGQKFGPWPMAGTRLFTTLNAKLCARSVAPINWELPR